MRTQHNQRPPRMKSPLTAGCVAILGLLLCTATIEGEERYLFRFDKPGSSRSWQTVNDGVMGGRSVGRFRINQDQHLEFFGNLSLRNNGGFASVRARDKHLAMKPDDVIVARIRGDGRKYTFNVYTQANLGGFSYRQSFQTQRNKWLEVRFPIKKFVATWRGRTYPREQLDPTKITGLGFLLGDKKAGPFTMAVAWIKTETPTPEMFTVPCQGTYQHHLQGVCTDEQSIYWSFTTTLVKTDMQGQVLAKTPVANHHGDLCCHEGKLYVAVNLGRFNDPKGNADSWVYVYDAKTLKETSRHETQEVFHGAGGIGHRNGHFFVVGGLPEDVPENYVYEYDQDFKFIKKHVLMSGHTHLGIQAATFAHGRWWFGCYGNPQVVLVSDASFQMKGKYELDGSLGIAGMSKGRLLVATGISDKERGCTGTVRTAIPSEKSGYRTHQPSGN